MGKKVLIIEPLAKPKVDSAYHRSFIRMFSYLLANADSLPFKLDAVHTYSPSTFPIDANRNECASKFLEWGYDYSVWFDTDQTFPDNTLFKLLQNVDHPVYAGMYFAKRDPYYPIVFNRSPQDEDFNLFWSVIDFPQDELFYVDMIGMGCVRINREVFEQIEMPYFKYQRHPMNTKAEDSEWRYKNLINDVSEDVWFCKLLAGADIPIVVDPRIQAGHITSLTVDNALFQSYLQESQQKYIRENGLKEYKKMWEGVCRPKKVKKQNSGGTSKQTPKEQIASGARKTG